MMNKQMIANLETWIAAIVVAALMGMSGSLTADENDKSSSGKPGETKTVQGKVVPLYTYLTGQNADGGQDRNQDSSTDRLNQNRGSRNEGRYDSDAQRRNERSSADRANDREGQRNARNLGGSDQADSAERDNRYGGDANRTTRLGNQWRAGNMNAGQPLALIATDEKLLGSGKDCYLLLFDPNDPSSERALLQAQQMARMSGSSMNEDFNESNRRNQIDSRASTEQENDRIQARDRQENQTQRNRDRSNASASTGQQGEASVTGRVIEKNGIQAMVVTSISHGKTEPAQSQKR